MGLIFAFIALISWGFGDFLMQRSARAFGDWRTLFYITTFGSIFLFPFVYRDIKPILFNTNGLLVLCAAALVLTFASYFDLEALRVGNISVVEPIYAFEIVVTTLFAGLILRENLSLIQLFLILMIVLGVFLVALKSWHLFKLGFRWEKGVFLAIIATLAMGMTNFLFGIGSRITNPLLLNWFANLFIAFVCFFMLVKRSELKLVVSDWRRKRKLIASVSVIDNMAWISFSYAVLHVPIAVATGISESYIALAALLGMKINKEQLKLHQKLGLGITIGAAVILAFFS